jgi:hypothetical protein
LAGQVDFQLQVWVWGGFNSVMVAFRAVHIRNSKDRIDEGWVVQRKDPDGLQIVVTKLFDTQQEALNEAARLTREASRRIMS